MIIDSWALFHSIKDLEEKLKESERRNSELLKKYEELEKQFQRKENVHLLEKCGMQVRKLLRCQKYYVIRETYIKLWKNNYVIYI